MKKFISLGLSLGLVLALTTGCKGAISNTSGSSETISVVSREDGSGTRGAFTEIIGILEKNSSGDEVDKTYDEAIIQNSTDAVMTTVAGDNHSIGYISLGSLNNTVKAMKINGVEATSENVQEGSYEIARPFNIAYKDNLNSLGLDFINFILSSQGQKIVVKEGYVQVDTNPSEYTSSATEGRLVIAGSTSVSPVMEKLAEKFEELNPDTSIEIQSTGSSAGMQATMEGNVDIGMASRDLKDSEKESLSYKAIALDGIVVITNIENTTDNISLENVKSIYMGEIVSWESLKK